MAKSAKLGQNFLHDANIARRIVDLVPPGTGPLLEIGPGKGILSRLLAERFPGRRLTLVEVDPLLATDLEHRFNGTEDPCRGDAVEIIGMDILRLDLAGRFAAGAVTVIGNLPYHISKPLIDWFIAQRPLIGEAVLMLQKDFVDKLLASHGGKKYNAQSVAFQLLFQARRCFDVPAGAFAPKPKVVSTVVTARPPAPGPGIGAGFYPFVRLCFAERRKTLWNNLSPRYGAAALTSAFAAAAIPPHARAEQLAPERFLALWRSLADEAEKETR